MSDTIPERPLPGEVHLKQWLYDQATKLGITTRAAECRYQRGIIKPLGIRRVSKRTIFVQTSPT